MLGLQIERVGFESRLGRSDLDLIGLSVGNLYYPHKTPLFVHGKFIKCIGRWQLSHESLGRKEHFLFPSYIKFVK